MHKLITRIYYYLAQAMQIHAKMIEGPARLMLLWHLSHLADQPTQNSEHLREYVIRSDFHSITPIVSFGHKGKDESWGVHWAKIKGRHFLD
jgi:hypothetical protein